MTSAEFKALQVKTPAKAPRKPTSAVLVPPTPIRTPERKEIDQQPPASKPLRWELAKGLHTEQFPTEFRMVVVGPREELPRLLEALHALSNPL